LSDQAYSRDWENKLTEALTSLPGPVHLVGVGNSIRTDDAVGLEIVSSLRSRLGATPGPRLRIHPAPVMPERLLSRLASGSGGIVVFDAVEAAKSPGDIVFCALGDTKYGFFATHNIPLRLVPGLGSRGNEVFVVGVQPRSLEVGEGLTDEVRASARRIVEVVARTAEGFN
jgi:hydrogenase maturation protease